jgi:hypothetical protein
MRRHFPLPRKQSFCVRHAFYLWKTWLWSISLRWTPLLDAYAHSGIGRHLMDLSPSTISTFSKVYMPCPPRVRIWWANAYICHVKTILATAIIYIPCLAFAKLALLMLYYRLLSTMRGWVYTIYVVAFIISGYSIALALALIFACRPIQKSWDPSIT